MTVAYTVTVACRHTPDSRGSMLDCRPTPEFHFQNYRLAPGQVHAVGSACCRMCMLKEVHAVGCRRAPERSIGLVFLDALDIKYNVLQVRLVFIHATEHIDSFWTP